MLSEGAGNRSRPGAVVIECAYCTTVISAHMNALWDSLVSSSESHQNITIINSCCTLQEISGEGLVALLATSGQPGLAMDLCSEIIERCPTAGWAWKLLAPLQLEAAEALARGRNDGAPHPHGPGHEDDGLRLARLRQDAVRGLEISI